jgi:YCII-related domain-containing protein
VLVTDGPFTESKEWIAGFDILECDDRDEAIAIAARHRRPTGASWNCGRSGRRRIDHRAASRHGSSHPAPARSVAVFAEPSGQPARSPDGPQPPLGLLPHPRGGDD